MDWIWRMSPPASRVSAISWFFCSMMSCFCDIRLSKRLWNWFIGLNVSRSCLRASSSVRSPGRIPCRALWLIDCVARWSCSHGFVKPVLNCTYISVYPLSVLDLFCHITPVIITWTVRCRYLTADLLKIDGAISAYLVLQWLSTGKRSA